MNIIEYDLNLGSMSFGNIPKLIVLHHAEAESCTIFDINNWHKDRGWAGCGYHYFIKKDGTIYKGRPDSAIGVHCAGHNTNSLGVCYEGNYMGDDMPEIQKNAGIELNKFLISKYGILDIEPHRALYNTACPGNKFPFEIIKNESLRSDGSNINYQPTEDRNWLQFGDTGENVKKLQENLIKLGYDLGNSGADGSYGKITKNAVYRFQHDNSLTEDGLAGPATMKCLNSKIYGSINNLVIKNFQHACNIDSITDENGNSLLEDGLAGEGGHTIWVIENKIWIHKGNKGELVKWLQNMLISLGFSCGSCGIDGSFGYATFIAVQNFQVSRGLNADGSCGPVTARKLLNI